MGQNYDLAAFSKINTTPLNQNNLIGNGDHHMAVILNLKFSPELTTEQIAENTGIPHEDILLAIEQLMVVGAIVEKTDV